MNRLHDIDSLPVAITLLRIIIAAILIVAASDKIADPNAFAASIINYKLVPDGPALLIATVLPWLELLVGLGLLCGLFVRGNALLALMMFVVFTAVVAIALGRGLDISCGCFSQDPMAERIGWKKIAEDVILVAMSYLILRYPETGFSPAAFLRKRSP